MSSTLGPGRGPAATHLSAEVNAIVRALRQLGVLQRDVLFKRVRARRWSYGTFDLALSAATREGRVRHLGSGFYEVTEDG